MTDSQNPAPEPDRERPILTPPGTKGVRKKNNRMTLLLLSVGLLLLLGVAAMVIWLLPHSADLKMSPSSQNMTELQSPSKKTALKQSGPARAEAEQVLGKWLKLQARAEADNVSVWGANSYPAIYKEAARADELLQERDFIEALAAYNKAIFSLQELLSSKEDRLVSALSKGDLALDNNDSLEATKAFELALAIEPNNIQAQKGMARARTLDQVLLLYNKGLDHERENDLEAAREILHQSTVLDKEFLPAKEALVRVEDSLREIAFQEAMSSTLKALAEKDSAAARRSLAEAARLRPTDISVQDAGKRLMAMEKAQKLLQLQEKAEKMVREERWTEALQVFDEALAIDPHFGFAETGRIFARQRFELDRDIRQIISNPSRLQEKGPLDEAEQVLARAQSIENPGPILQKQATELAELVRTASTPVEITMRSDNETSVIIYRIGRLGKFLQKSVALLPGTYTVVGSRPGFRDVRLTLKVQAGDNPNIIEIRCEEPI
jgi:tetratricopeptide (TPR) repeat protein